MELTYCSSMAHSFGRCSDRWRPLLTFIHNPTHSSRSSLPTPSSRMTDLSANSSHSTPNPAPQPAMPFFPALSFTFSTSQGGRPGAQRQERPYVYSAHGGRHVGQYDQGHGGWYQSEDGHYHAYYYDEDGTSYYPYYNYGEDGLCSDRPATMPVPTDVVPSPPAGIDRRGMSPPPPKRHRTSVASNPSTAAVGRQSAPATRRRAQQSEHDTSIVPCSRTPSLSPSPCPSPPPLSATLSPSISLSVRGKRTTKRSNELSAVTPSPTPSTSSTSSLFGDPQMPANTESYDPTAREDSASSSTSSRSDSRRTADAADAADASDGASDETLYRTDRRRRQQGPPQMHICPMPGCDKQFVRRFNLKVHIITHDPERAHQFECIEGCGRRYTRKNDMERHVKSVHLGERLKCQTCGFRFTRVDGLRKHNCNSPMSSPYIAEGGHTPRTLRPLVNSSSTSASISSSSSSSASVSSSRASSVAIAGPAAAAVRHLQHSTRPVAQVGSSTATRQGAQAAWPPLSVSVEPEDPTRSAENSRPRFLLPAPHIMSMPSFGSQTSTRSIVETPFMGRRSEPAVQVQQETSVKEEKPADKKLVWSSMNGGSNM